MFKKILLFLTSLFLFSSFAFAKTSDEVLIEISVTTDNISQSEGKTLIPSVAEKLEANLTKYTDFTILNSVNQKDIFSIQAKTESDVYESSIELSKFKSPTHELFTTIRNMGKDGYRLSIRFTDLTTGSSKTFLSSVKKNINELYITNGCAVDEVTIDICEHFNVPLDPIQIVSIMEGDSDLSNDEMNTLYDEEIENYKKRIAQAQKELDLSKVSSDVNASILEAKYKSDKALAEEKLRIAEENKKKLKIAIDKKKEQEELDATRSLSQKNRISSMASELDSKMREVRNKNYENESVLGQINIIENRKKAVIEIFGRLDFEEKNIIETAKKDIIDKQKEIMNAAPKSIETEKDKKTLTEKAIANRKKRFRESRNEILNDAKKNLEQLSDTLSSARDELLQQIGYDSYNLKTRFISTLGDDLVVTYSPYDGYKQGWDLSVTAKCDGVTLFTTKSFLPFETLTGINPDVYFEEDFDGYSDDVDFYDSLFLRGSDVLVFSLKYDVKALDIDHPSQYRFTFRDLNFYDTATLSVVDNNFTSSKTASLDMADTTIVKKMANSYNMKPYESYMKKFEGNTLEVATSSSSNSNSYLPIMYTTYYPKKIINDSGEFIAFGDFPTAFKHDNVEIDKSKKKIINSFECFMGSDNYYYTPVTNSKGSVYYYKITPLTWNRLDTAYVDGEGKLQENLYISTTAMHAMAFYKPKQEYSDMKKTKNNRGDILNNNYKYSTVRAYLNNLDGTDYNVYNYESKGILNRAFSSLSRNLINTTCVDNSEKSTYMEGFDMYLYDEPSKLYCENTYDKLFLLSRNEQGRYYKHNGDFDEPLYRRDKLILATGYAAMFSCPYAKENTTWTEWNQFSKEYEQVSLNNKSCAEYLLRSPDRDENYVRMVDSEGYFLNKYSGTSDYLGIVPLFTITNENLGF